MIKTVNLNIHSSNQVPEFIDITGRVEEIITGSKVIEGQVLIFAAHTTAAVIIQESEVGVQKDIHELLHSLLPKDKHYHHSLSDDHLKDRMPNGHSHVQHALLGASEVIPISDGQMLLGRYQKVFLVELDRSRERTIVVQVLGEGSSHE